MYKQASDISCKNMATLAKKHQDYNNELFKHNMLSMHCGQGYPEGDIIESQYVNNKHCHYVRDNYDMEWWNSQYGSCVGEQFNINTKAKNNHKKNIMSCQPPDFSCANLISKQKF